MPQVFNTVAHWCGFVALAISLGGPTANGQSCSTDLLTRAVPNIAANGASGSPYITANGRYVAFLSHASDLPGTPVPTQPNFAKVYIYDTSTHEISLGCAGLNGAEPNDDCFIPSVSEDGRYVAFISYATNLVANSPQYNYYFQVYVYDRTAQTTQRASVSNQGDPATYGATNPAISSSGRYVVFESDASNLVPGDSNFRGDIFVRDLLNGVTSRVSVTASGAQANSDCYQPSISADGRYIAFLSAASSFGVGGVAQAYRKDTVTGDLRLVSRSSAGIPANNSATQPAISSDGRYVVFASRATNLVAGVATSFRQIFLRDLNQPGVILASRSGLDEPANSECSSPSVTAGGHHVMFVTGATNLVAGPATQYPAVFLRDTLQGAVSVVSVTPGGQGPAGNIGEPWAYYSVLRHVSDDARWAVMLSNSTDLAGPDRNGQTDIVVRDRLAGANFQVTTTRRGANDGGDDHSYAPSITADGHRVVFVSLANNLTPGNTLNFFGGNTLFPTPFSVLYLRDDASPGISPVTWGDTGLPVGNGVTDPVVSADGHWIVYEYADASQLVYGELVGSTFRYAASPAQLLGTQHDAPAHHPSLSANGQFVAFESDSDGIVVGDSNHATDVFVYDRVTRQRTLVSRTPLNIQGNGDSYAPSISGDGRFVAFCSTATNLVRPDPNGAAPDIFVADRIARTLRKASSPQAGDSGGSYRPAISADGRFVAFESDAATLVPGDSNDTSDVFVANLQSGTVERVSIGPAGAQANGPSLAARISADGRYVSFESVATNLVAGASTPVVRMYVHDLQTHTTYLAAASHGDPANADAFQGVLSADGRNLAFTSYATNLGATVDPDTAQLYLWSGLCLPSATCRADFNASGAVSAQDIFDFLAAWFSLDPRADFNNSGSITAQDIFDFLAAWFAGC